MADTFHKIRAGAGCCTFLHKDGFLASFDTLEQAIEAASILLVPEELQHISLHLCLVFSQYDSALWENFG